MKKNNLQKFGLDSNFSHQPARSPDDSLVRMGYRSVILSVAGSLLCLASGLQAQDQPAPSVPADALNVPPPALKEAKVEKRELKNEVGVSGDFMFGSGTVTLPIGFALSKALPDAGLKPQALSADRSTEYFGATFSYSYGRNWYLDLSYEHGVSTGSQIFSFENTQISGQPGSINTRFNYNDDWYQLYLRYNFSEWLKGTRFKAYLRGGVSMVQASMTAVDTANPSIYNQKNESQDILGNLGFGLRYSLYSTLRIKVALQVEGEGFYGTRSQKSTEELPLDINLGPVSTTIDNSLYGGLGRGTLHGEWLMGQSGRLKLFGDLGAMFKYTVIDYPGTTAPNEFFWGPYVKLGVSYVF
jgi:hypothetical protein